MSLAAESPHFHALVSVCSEAKALTESPLLATRPASKRERKKSRRLQEEEESKPAKPHKKQKHKPSNGESHARVQPPTPKRSPAEDPGGSSCHQCKSRRHLEDLTFCTSSLNKKNKSAVCRKKYCSHCLNKFYKDIPLPQNSSASWRCPSCRKICCCAACRRREQRGKAGAGVGGEDLVEQSPALTPSKGPSEFALPPPPMESPQQPADNERARAFALYFAVSQLPEVKNRMGSILSRPAETDTGKVDKVASMLSQEANRVTRHSRRLQLKNGLPTAEPLGPPPAFLFSSSSSSSSSSRSSNNHSSQHQMEEGYDGTSSDDSEDEGDYDEEEDRGGGGEMTDEGDDERDA